MGACSDLLQQIVNILSGGLLITDAEGDPVLIATEDGNIADIKALIAAFDVDPVSGALTVTTTFSDPDTGLSAEINYDDVKKAMYVQSESLLTEDQLKALLGEAVASPATNTLLSRIKNVEALLTNIDGNTDSLTLSNQLQGKFNISFEDSDPIGTVGSLDDIPVPANLQDAYLISFVNNSEESDIEVQLYLNESFQTDEVTPTPYNAWSKHGESFQIAAGPDADSPGGATAKSARSVQVEGAFLAQGLGISIKLVDGVGASGAFSVDITIRER